MAATPATVKAVFDRALEIDSPADRDAYLDAACVGALEVRREVEALLRAYVEAGNFLEPPSLTPADVTAEFEPAVHRLPAFETGAHLPAEATGGFEATPTVTERSARGLGIVIAGRYTLAEVIGEGGMGSVYLAEQTEPVKRQVALKLIKMGMDSKAVLARFDAERQALALMDHPNIARVYDGGTTPTGQPFFVMELVQGIPLTEYCDQKRLSVKARLELFVSVCQAVQHAHQKGIIHRDLKPGNVLVTEVDGRPTSKVIDFGVAKATEQKLTDLSFADTGAIVGTPAYMSPEQADPSSMDIDTRTDVYALGVILYELLVGSPPIDSKQFKRGAILEMLRMVREFDPPRPSTKLSTAEALPDIAANRGIEPAKLARSLQGELDWVVMKALEKDRTRRYDTANGLARDIQRYLADEVVEARPPSTAYRIRKWMKRHPERAAAVAVAALVVVGGVVAGFQVQQVLADQRVAAETKRLDDLRTADEVARQQQREARAETLVRALAAAEPGAVPILLNELAQYRELARPHLRELAARPIEHRAGLHGRLALMADSGLSTEGYAEFRAEILGYFRRHSRSDELLLLIDHLTGFIPTESILSLWKIWADPKPISGTGKRYVRQAALLARLDPNNPQWQTYAETVAAELVRFNPADVEPFVEALRPVRGHLLSSLMTRYPESHARIEYGKLAVSDLVAEATAFDLLANLLARYAADRPAELAELAVTVDARHYRLFAEAIRTHHSDVAPLLKAELGRVRLPAWAQNGELGSAFAAALGCAAAADLMDADAVIARAAKRRGHAAAALLTLGEGEAVWQAFQFPAHGDPTARSYLVQRLAGIGADPLSLIRRFDAETDVSAKRALLVALGDFQAEQVAGAVGEAFVGRLLVLYREHPDPGLHGAIDWVLRQKWGKGKELAPIDAGLVAAARVRAVARGLTGVRAVGGVPLPVGPLLPPPGVPGGRNWYVNGEGQTYTVVRGPVEFSLGSPLSEPGRVDNNEPLHRKRIGRTFAVATKEVTVEQFLRFRPEHQWTKRYSPDPDTPAVGMTWYEAAEYCNWLSEREGIPQDQWCYETDPAGKFTEGMRMKAGHLNLTGYRLPTEAEWEFACRGGSVTSRYHGRGDELLPRYGWLTKNADDRAWPVGQLRPNELGLFDTLGNALEWCQDPAISYATGQKDDVENLSAIDERVSRILRGGSFDLEPVLLRCAYRFGNRPGGRFLAFGLRPARTFGG